MCKAQLVFQRADMVVTDGRRSSSSRCKTALKHNFYCFLLSRSLLCVRKWGFPELTSVILLFDISDADAFCLGNFSCLCCPKPAHECCAWKWRGSCCAPMLGSGEAFRPQDCTETGNGCFLTPVKEHLEFAVVRFSCPWSVVQYLQLSQDV